MRYIDKFFRENEIGEEGCLGFGVFLPEFSALQSLEINLWNNNIKETGAKYLSLALKKMNK